MDTRNSQLRKGLLVLASKKRVLAVKPRRRSSSSSLDDMILASMGEIAIGFGKLSASTGYVAEEIEISPGVTVKLERHLRVQWFGDRLRKISAFAQSIALTQSLDLDCVRRKLLRGDGWAFTHGILKTPLWMKPDQEVEIVRVASMLGLRWVASLDESSRWHDRGAYDEARAAY